MQLAILGTDDDILQLAAAARTARHEIVWLGDVRPADAEAVSQVAPGLADRASEWELLLDRAVVDAVLVGRGTAPNELRAEQLKRLAAEAVPLLVVHPALDSVLSYYELDMTRRETHCIVRHYNPLAGHPIVNELADWVRNGHPTIGPIHQVTCERRVTDGSRTSVLAHLARDIELLSTTAGHIRRVTAIGPSDQRASFASLQVQMKSTGAASLRWSVGSPASGNCGLTTTLIGERGSVALRVPEPSLVERHSTWQFETDSDELQDRRALPPYDAPLAAIRQLGEAVTGTNPEQRAAVSTWDAATRAMEVVDAIELSLEKGRTIEVYQQQLTERLAFRGTMAALGCGLLLVGFVAIVLVTLLGGAEGTERRHLLPSWEFVLLAVLAFFLLMQAVPLLANKSKQDRDASTADASTRSDLN